MKAKLITRQGWERLSAELQQLWKVERPEVTRAVSEAAALGDRSENAEYIYGKKRLREIDRRVGYLSRQLEDLKIVDYSPEQDGRVFFGATVELENEAGTIVRYRIVGGDEIEAGSQNISIDSPMARALIGKHVDDEVVVKTPSGALIWNINAISYEQ